MHVAGVVELEPVGELDRCAQWREQLDVNLVAPDAAHPRVPAGAAARPAAPVVFVNSGAGLSASAAWSAYAASKFGLRALADALRAEERRPRRPGHHGLPQPHRDPDAGEGARAGGQGPTTRRGGSSPETVAATILHVLDLPPDATIPEVTVRPLVPRPT